MKAKGVVGLVVFLLAYPMLAAADEPLAVDIRRLTMESALLVADTAIKACRKQGIPVGVVVVDRGGRTQVALRDTVAVDLTLNIGEQKAYTALSFNVPTSQLNDRAGSALGSVDGLVMAAGGLPISAGGVIYGAVGVSGAPSGKQDEACAKAGVDALVEELEMSE